MTATIKDVAKIAKVSPSTVSRVIADSPRISKETKLRVEQAIKELNYHPNIIARSLANKSTKILGLIIPNTSEDLFKNPFFIQVMTGMSIYAQKRGYYIMYSYSKQEDEELKFLKNYSNSKLVDGFILLTSKKDDKCIEFLKKNKYPFVVVGRPEDINNVLWVDNDNFKAMYNVVDMFIQKGHKDIAFIGGPKEFNMSKDRLEGYKKALEVHGIFVDDNMIVQETNFNEVCGYNAMSQILKYKIPTAVATTDDLLAFGALRAISELTDKKIAIAGFNNTPLSVYQNPPLSSVDINAEELGYCAAKLLIGKLENELISTNHYIVETKFIERESTK
ncbi:LacI family transcriptional regulator [Caloramator sp. E03]|uniref:LacI family DNA-binding transcriptional regulator n=1 Tax=Caloramator sp. E03 TaxID=2576307 RepID=UPI00111032A3|nr:LacI family DNA-binding transcriptional regulator [Caloramator sp. E03]QCX33025.1 LacI family transcriptional regulator [Caloramator sp. E03]